MTDKPVKSVAKTISYIISHYALQLIAVYLFTKDINLSVSIILIEMSIESLYYYFHERVWNKISNKLKKRKHSYKVLDELV